MKHPLPSLLCLLALLLLAGCSSLDRNERRILRAHDVSPVVFDKMSRWQGLSLDDIIELSQRQVPTQLITHYLYSTRVIYTLDKPTLARLQKAKVSQEVITYLLGTPYFFGPKSPANDYWYPYYDPYPFYGPVIISGHGHHHHHHRQ